MHLIARKAFAADARVLGRRGLLLVHISNQFLDLEPVVAAIASRDAWTGVMRDYRPSPLDTGKPSPSVWIALSPNPVMLSLLTQRESDWAPIRSHRYQRLNERPFHHPAALEGALRPQLPGRRAASRRMAASCRATSAAAAVRSVSIPG